MSSRVLRKLHGDQRIGSLPDQISDTEDQEIPVGARKKQFNVNRYDLLHQASQSESEVKEDDDENDPPRGSTSRSPHEVRESTRRKKKKKRKKVASAQQSSEDIDEVERSVREVNALLGDVSFQGPKQETRPAGFSASTLKIEPKHLNPKCELSRIFGIKVIHGANKKKRTRGRGHLKNFNLVTPREEWSYIDKAGISMSLVDIKDGIQYFAFVHNSAYQTAQMKFFNAVESLNPENLISLVDSTPYHIDTLIQVSEICQLNEELAMAASIIERALYCFECSFHPEFNIAQGNCRLNYRRQENRGFFIALFKHLKFVGQRACYRTALEFCKLILSFDPDEDPLGIILTIDFYAIRASEYDWLIRFVEELDATRNLSQLPNFAFSIAVAHFYLHHDCADSLLQDALLMFPGVLLSLLEKCGVHTDSRTSTHSYFLNAASAQETSLSQLVKLYLCRNYHVWKEAELMSWLERNTTAVMDLVDKKDPRVEDYAAKRARRFNARPPRAVARHIFLSDIKEALPEHSVDTASQFSFDPYPPLDSINLYVRPERPRRIDNLGALTMFFSSVMPNFNANEPALDLPPVDEDAAAGGGEMIPLRTSLHNSVAHLFEAMRELLTNLQVTQDADAETDSGSDDEESNNEG